MNSRELIVKKVKCWAPPEENDARVLGMPNIYYALQGCLEGDAQVLTPNGWKRIDKVTDVDTVMTWSDGLLFFDEVQATHQVYTEYAYKIGYRTEHNFDMLYSPEHRIPLEETHYSWGVKGRYKYDTPKKVLKVTTADKFVGKSSRKFYTAARGTGKNEGLTADERILIAIQADGYLIRKNHLQNSDYVYRISVKKIRKIARLRELLPQSSFRWTELRAENGYAMYKVWVPKESKTFSNVFSYSMGYKKARAFIQELWEWDGYVGKNQRCYTSARYDNIEFVQAIAAQAGYTTNTKKDIRSGTVTSDGKKHGDCWSIWFLDRNTRGTANTKKEKVYYGKDMYCITVPSSFFLVKYHDVVIITGNCGMQPRTIEGATEWNKMRKLCYYKAKWRCEACGEYQGPGKTQAHEIFKTDWQKGQAVFIRLICLCERCHLGVIHSGRALSMYQQGDWRMPKSKLLEGVEHGFKTVSDWNKTHADQEPILLYSTFLSYFEDPTLREDMERLFKKYNVKLYGNCKPAEWSKWRMIYNKKIYPTPYKDKDDYVEQMHKQHAVQNKEVDDVAGRRAKAVAELEKALKGE